MNGIFDEDHTCICGTDDPGTERLRDLVSGGMDQWAASRVLWGPITEVLDIFAPSRADIA